MPYALKNDKNFKLKPLGNISTDAYRPYREFADDYAGNYQIDNENRIGVCEIKGWRPTQEDVLAINHEAISAFKILDREQQKIAYISTFDKVQKKYCEYSSQGSTACVVTTWIDGKRNTANFVTGNLGDSTGIVILMNSNNKIIKSKRLNKLHKPADPEEELNINIAGGFVTFHRLGGVLALSRAFGDTQFGSAISHSPDIYFDEENLGEDVKAFVLVACDGLEENLSENEVYKIIEENAKETPDQIANKLVSAAYRSGSRDNISVAFAPISETCTSIAIFDGHGGNDVSHALGDNFYNEFVNELTAVQTPNIFAETQAQYERESSEKEKEKSHYLELLPQVLDKIKQENFQSKNIKVRSGEQNRKFSPPMVFIESNDSEIIKRVQDLASQPGIHVNSIPYFCDKTYKNVIGMELDLKKLPDINVINQFYAELHKIGLDSNIQSSLQSQSIFKQSTNLPSDSNIENKFEGVRLG